MRILVTGATGFVGACLCRRLLGLGHELHLFVRQTANIWRIADIAHQMVLHDVDLRDAQAVQRSVAAIRPERIFHLATYGGFSFQKEVAAIHAVNFLGTVNLLQACEKVGFEQFIHTGSSSEYGIKAEPMKETDLLEPLGDYAVSKAAATLFCRSEALLKGLPIVTLRVFSPYGPWDDPQRLIPYVIAALLKGNAPLLANPAAVRDYLFIDDVIDAYLAVMAAPLRGGENLQHRFRQADRHRRDCGADRSRHRQRRPAAVGHGVSPAAGAGRLGGRCRKNAGAVRLAGRYQPGSGAAKDHRLDT